MKLLRLLSLLLLCSNALAKPQTEWLKDAQKRYVTEVLPNGLTVVCYPMPGLHTVRVGITYDVGSKDELPGEYGLAHMIEHMIFKGTEKMSETDLKAIAEKFCAGSIGHGFNAFTSRDTTRYYFNTDKDNYGVFIDILADCMFNVRFDENHFASEVKAVIEEINLRSPNLGAFVYDTVSSMAYLHGHPYHHPIIGYKESLLQATNEDLKRFYKRNYHPSRALLTIVGDVDVKQSLALARKAFSTKIELPERKEVVQKPSLTESFARKKLVTYKPIPNPEQYYIWKTPEGKDGEARAFILAKILHDRLQKIAVREKDLVLSIGAHPISERLGSLFFISFSPKENRSIKDIKAVIYEEIDKLIQEGPTATEVDCFKKSLEALFLGLFETAEGVASLTESEYFPSRSIDTPFTDFEDAKKVTPEDIKAFAKAYLRPLLSYSIQCLPIPEEEKEQWAKLRQEEDTYEQVLLQQKIRESDIEPARYAHTLPEPKIPTFKAQHPDKELTLSNGLKVYLKHRESTPFVQGTLQFRDQELFGITVTLKEPSLVNHFAMSFINEGTDKFSRDQLREYFELRGASVNFQAMSCTFSCPADSLNEVTTKVLEMMKQPKYDKTLMAQHIQSTLQQLQMGKMSPGYMAGRTLGYELQKEYPWVLTDDEISEKLGKISREELVRFNKRYLNPENMFLVLVGNIDLDTIKQDLEKTFGTWKNDKECSRELVKKEDIPVIANPEPKTIIKTIPVDQVILALGRITTYAGTDEMHALRIIQPYLEKRLFEIRERTGLFYAGQSQLISGSLITKGLALAAFPLSVNNVEQAEAAIKDTLADIAKNGIPEEHIKKTKELILMDLVKLYTTNAALCGIFAQIVAINRPWDVYETRLAEIQALTKKSIDAVAKKYLDPSQWTTVKAGRIEGGEGEGKGMFGWLF